MTDNLLDHRPNIETEPDTPPATAGGRPPYLPEKFWDAATGQPRIEALARSYAELERKLSGMVRLPGAEASDDERQGFLRALGVPDTPDGYQVTPPHPMLEPDPEVNRRLHEAGFTPPQVQTVYDLAAEVMVPVVYELAAEYEADRQHARLVEHFGGEERFAEIARQINAWGRKQLPPEVMEGLSGTFEGVLALHRMMTSGEPGLRPVSGQGEPAVTEDALKDLMRDPKYWRDKDPGTVRKVAEGFRKLYPDQG